jgi:hypothetical protein
MRIFGFPNTDIITVHFILLLWRVTSSLKWTLRENRRFESRLQSRDRIRIVTSIFWFQSLNHCGFISKRLLRISETVVCGSCNSRLAWRVGCCGLHRNQVRTRSTVTSHTQAHQDTCLCKCILSDGMSYTSCKCILGGAVRREIV